MFEISNNKTMKIYSIMPHVVWCRGSRIQPPVKTLISAWPVARPIRLIFSSKDTIARVSGTPFPVASFSDPAANNRTKDDEQSRGGLRENWERRGGSVGGGVAVYEAVAHFHAVTSTHIPGYVTGSGKCVRFYPPWGTVPCDRLVSMRSKWSLRWTTWESTDSVFYLWNETYPWGDP